MPSNVKKDSNNVFSSIPIIDSNDSNEDSNDPNDYSSSIPIIDLAELFSREQGKCSLEIQYAEKVWKLR